MTESASSTATSHDAHEHADHGGIGKYLAVFVALCVLTTASFMTYMDFWPFGPHVTWAFMMAVSCTKAMLVVMFFMHLMWEANWKYVLTIPATCMSLFLLLMLVPDVGMRQNNGYAEYSRERLLHAADPQPASVAVEPSHDEAAPPSEHAAPSH